MGISDPCRCAFPEWRGLRQILVERRQKLLYQLCSAHARDDIDYLLFGGVVADYKTGSSNHYLFTGYESDSTESSTDYATFRNLSYPLARFNRPDPGDGSYDLTDPQSFNRYSYVRNSPVTWIDPRGLDPVCVAYDAAIGCINWGDNADCNGLAAACVSGTSPSSPSDSDPTCTGDCFLPGDSGPGPGLGGLGGGAPSNATPWYKTCSAKAIGSGLLHIGIDAIGLIPEAEGFTKAFENEAGYQLARAVGNSAGYRGVQE